ncbi:MAG: hypothetical protein AAF787_21035, partial [Chloroflexota bacterium]
MYGEFSKYSICHTRQEKIAAKRYVIQVYERVSQLTPAGKRLLSTLLRSYRENHGMPLNRKEIAALLSRPTQGLTPHDRKLLGQLKTLELLISTRATLWTPERSPCGAEYRYSMSEDTAWALNVIRQRARQQRLK